MAEVFRFNGNEIQDLCEQIETNWRTQVWNTVSNGWSISDVDFSQLVAVFSSLSIKPQYEIKAYQFKQGRDGNAKVFAMPKGEDLPPVQIADDEDFIEPSVPERALNNVAKAISGDQTPWSYLCASVLIRELLEVGAFGHGAYWAAFRILDELPQTYDGRPWQWKKTQPECWSPSVEVRETSVQVEFFTYCGLGSEKIIHHTDIYSSKEDYQFDSQQDTIAQTSDGYIW